MKLVEYIARRWRRRKFIAHQKRLSKALEALGLTRMQLVWLKVLADNYAAAPIQQRSSLKTRKLRKRKKNKR